MAKSSSVIKRPLSGDELRQPSFTASEELADALQQVHVDLIKLHVQGKQAHWNVLGTYFCLQLDEIDDARRVGHRRGGRIALQRGRFRCEMSERRNFILPGLWHLDQRWPEERQELP